MSGQFVTPEAIFYFDIVCPFAFIASERLPDIAKFTGANITWKPVVLGALYGMTDAPQGKDGSASDVGSMAKKLLMKANFEREARRYGLPIKFHKDHPLKSVDAGRLLCAFPAQHRPALARALYRAYFYDGANINSRPTLLRIARGLKLTSLAAPTHAGPFAMKPSLPFQLDESVFSDVEREDQLRANTQEAFDIGAFGVPTFYIPKLNKMIWGQDRMHLLEAELISIKLSKPVAQIRQLERLHPRCLRTPPEDRKRTLSFWFDISSPWAYLAYSQLERLQREAGNGLTIEMKPFLLGALFKAIGTPLVPMTEMSAAKQAYAQQDLKDWEKYWTAVCLQEYPPLQPPTLNWPEKFPIRSVTSLRVILLEPKTIPFIYTAAWRDNVDVSDDKVLAQLLTEKGFNGQDLVMSVTTGRHAETTKAQLRANTDEAVKLGLCGAPTFQYKDTLIWGGDKFNQVQDLVLGWRPDKSTLKASVAAFPHYDYRL